MMPIELQIIVVVLFALAGLAAGLALVSYFNVGQRASEESPHSGRQPKAPPKKE